MQTIKYIMILPLLMWLVLSAMPVKAELVENLYQSEQLVAENLSLPSPFLIKTGIKQVLMKVGGSLKAAYLVDELISDPASFLREFRFEPTREVHTDAKGNDYLAQRLVLTFEAEVINSLLLAHGLRPIGKFRPKLLVWLLGDVSDATFAHYKERVQQHANELAFPVDVILYHEQKSVKRNRSLSDHIRYRSKAYGKAFVVIVSVDSNSRFAWRLLDPDESLWHLVKGSFIEEQASVFQKWIESSGVMVVGGDKSYLNSHQITVTSVKNVADYAAIMEYILSLSSISHLAVVSMRDQVLTLSLLSSLEVAALTQVLHLDRRMMLMRPLQDEDVKSLRWRWIGSRGK